MRCRPGEEPGRSLRALERDQLLVAILLSGGDEAAAKTASWLP